MPASEVPVVLAAKRNMTCSAPSILAGVMFLVAAGNTNPAGVNNDITPSYPAQYSVATACGPGLPQQSSR